MTKPTKTLNSDEFTESNILLSDGIKDRDSCAQNWRITTVGGELAIASSGRVGIVAPESGDDVSRGTSLKTLPNRKNSAPGIRTRLDQRL
jgi:hypothetical protein